MKFAIIESYLKGMPEPPQTVEGLTKKVNELTAEMRFPPLSGNEMKQLVKRFCRQAEDEQSVSGTKASNKGRRSTKDDEMKNESSENF
ncbi:MAG: hypothetical protein ACLUER_00565 [Odoribacter splanchnicus]